MENKELWIEVDVVDASMRVVCRGYELDGYDDVVELSINDIYKYYYLNRILGLEYRSSEYINILHSLALKKGLDAIPKDAIDYIKEKFEIKSNWYFKNIDGNKKSTLWCFLFLFFNIIVIF